MNPFRRIGAGIAAGFQRAQAAIRKTVARLIPPKEPDIGIINEPEEPKSIAREKKRKAAELEAYERAIWAIQYGMQNPDNETAQMGKDKAIEYLNRSKELSGKGKRQDWNRQIAAEKWIRSDLSSEAGQKKRFDKALQQMNRNLNINLSPETYDTLKNMTKTEGFKKLNELYSMYYKEIYGAVADEVDSGSDPVRIEQTLELFSRVGLDDFEAFSDIINLDPENYGLFYERINESIYDVNPDEINVQTVFSDILEEFEI